MKRLRGSDRRDAPFRRSDANQTDPGATAARARVERLLEEMTRVDLQVIVVAPPDATRLAAEDRARDAALLAGRDTLLRDATAAVRDATIQLFARAGFSGTWAFTEAAISVATAGDRVAAAAAFEEAAMAAVVEDLVDPETVEVLRSTSDQYERFGGLPSPGSLSAFAAPAGKMISGPLQVAIVVLFVVVCFAFGLFAGSSFGLILLALGVAILAAMARRYRRPGP
jgi:hypothetical protein